MYQVPGFQGNVYKQHGRIQTRSRNWNEGRFKVLGGPNITANLYCISLSEHETCAYTDAVQICDNIGNAY